MEHELVKAASGKTYIITEKIYVQTIGECERKFYDFKKIYGDSWCSMVTGIKGFIPPGNYLVLGGHEI